MKEAVELLMTKAKKLRDDAEADHKRVTARADEVKRAAFAEAGNLKRAAQEVCDHSGPLRTESDDDYHKRESWTNHYCTLCEKLVKRV
ncbi:hypothetical protein [Achromobacter mucicolens]|uniref:hypothetical protein n=1 Tax=Achromobacter mucicolens TaxID=1389922 RepID=UPI002FE31AA1